MNDWDKRAETTELSRVENEEFIAARLRYFNAVNSIHCHLSSNLGSNGQLKEMRIVPFFMV